MKNKLSEKVRIILDVIVIILILSSSVLIFFEINYIKKHGGDCVSDPMGWAEQYAYEKHNKIIKCSCQMQRGFLGTTNLGTTNLSNFKLEEEK